MTSKAEAANMADRFEVDIAILGGSWPDMEERLRKAAREALSQAAAPEGSELSIVLADDAFIQNLNYTYRGKNSATNVLAFPQEEPGGHCLGDVVMAFETIQRECGEQGKTFPDHALHLMVHGILHLLGHDHDEQGRAQEMECLEICILAGLGIKNPY
jgi:probable rRNA maturation factor